jgi:hypothetical protein
VSSALGVVTGFSGCVTLSSVEGCEPTLRQPPALPFGTALPAERKHGFLRAFTEPATSLWEAGLAIKSGQTRRAAAVRLLEDHIVGLVLPVSPGEPFPIPEIVYAGELTMPSWGAGLK